MYYKLDRMASEETLKELYYLGYEHASDNAPVVDWFKSEIEKAAYIQGRFNFEIANSSQSGEYKEWSNVYEEIKKKVK